jgi:hypothetical protein
MSSPGSSDTVFHAQAVSDTLCVIFHGRPIAFSTVNANNGATVEGRNCGWEIITFYGKLVWSRKLEDHLSYSSIRLTMSNVSFILIEPPGRSSNETSLFSEWKLAFSQHLQPKDLERFSFLESRLGQLKDQVTFDCIVSPANSYGIMDGGLATAQASYLIC